jgi:transposase
VADAMIKARERTAKYFLLKGVSADNASLSNATLETMAKHNAMPFIPFKINTALPTVNSIWAEMYDHFMDNREEVLAHDHKRSNIETALSMIKAKFDDAVGVRATEGN